MTKASKTFRDSTILALLFVAAGCRGDNAANAQQTRTTTAQVREQLGPVPAQLDTATAARLSGAFRGAADRALPAVVQIRVTTSPQTVAANNQRRFLPPGFNIPGMPDDLDPQEQPRGRGTGSGFIFDPRGYILTNNHVVENASAVRVVLVNGREYDAKVVGTDPYSDVAVIKIEPRNGDKFAVANFGSSENLRVGDWVLALGSPLGLDFTVTAGIVSAFSRSIDIMPSSAQQSGLESFIQTDAAINPGNSGGPLVDLMGNVIGVNTAIQSSTGFFAGAGFAIPIDLAQKNAKDIIEYGAVHRPRLGVEVGRITEADAEVFKLPSVGGAAISSVQPGQPADRAGIKMGDVVVSLDGKPIRSQPQFMQELAEHRPGEEVTLGLVRYGQPMQVKVKLGEFEAPKREVASAPRRTTSEELLGFRAAPLTQELARQIRYPSEVKNQVVIASINRYGPAAEKIPSVGWEVVSINGQQIDSPSDVERVANRLKPGDVVSLVLRSPVDANRTFIVNYRTSN